MKRLITAANTLQLKVGNEYYLKMAAPISDRGKPLVHSFGGHSLGYIPLYFDFR